MEESNDPAAAFHLARTFEAQEETGEAVRFFAAAGRFGHAARLARSAGMDAELMNLALQSPPEMMLDSAQYFQERGQPEKACTLINPKPYTLYPKPYTLDPIPRILNLKSFTLNPNT